MEKETLKNWLIVLLSAIILLGGFFLYKQEKQPKDTAAKQQAVNKIEVREFQAQNVLVSQNFIGRVAAVNSVEMMPYLGGYIEEIPADSGQKVKKGDVIIVLRQNEYKAALASAEAAIFSGVADLKNAESQYQRLINAGNKAVSQIELDNAKTAVLTAEAQLKQAKSAYETAKINLNYTLIRAPFDGVLGNINVSVGDFVSPSMNKSLVRIVQYNPARVVFSITDKEFLQRENLFEDKVKVQLSNDNLYPFEGNIIYTENALEKSTNTLTIYAEVKNPDRKLLPNAYVKVYLEHIYKNVVVISKDIVLLKNDGNYVYAVKDGVLSLIPVKILAEKENDFIVQNTFEADEQLVAQNVEANLLGKKVQTENVSKEGR